MPSNHVDEDWSEADLDVLLDLAFANLEESRRCYEADCPLAAYVMLASAFEATLLSMVIANESRLRADKAWPVGASHLLLTDLVGRAGKQGWLDADATRRVVEVLNTARTMAAHPGAYVRGMRSAPSDLDLRDPDGYPACLDIVVNATEQLKDAHETVLRSAACSSSTPQPPSEPREHPCGSL